MSQPHWKARCSELESLLDDCIEALRFVPTGAIRSGATWMPSPEALILIEMAKDRVAKYEARRAVQ